MELAELMTVPRSPGFKIPAVTIGRLWRKPFTMYDSVDVTEIPKDAVAVACYTDGLYKNCQKARIQCPKAKLLRIAVFAKDDAEALDVERGDATPTQVPGWVNRQRSRGVKRPVVYSSVSFWPDQLRILRKAGIRRRQVRVWTAHYTGVPHRCTRKCDSSLPRFFKADATQFTDKALGRNLDASHCRGRFLAV